MLVVAAVTIYTIAQALDSSSASSTADSTADTTVEQQFTSEEIDKIIEDLKVSGTIDNVLSKLDEIIERAKLNGNSALEDYATNMKSAYQLKKQLDSINALVEASKKKNSGVSAVDAQIQKLLSVTTIVDDLRGAVSDEALLVLESLSDNNVKSLQDLLAEIQGLVDLSDVNSLSVQQRSLLDVLVLSRVIDDGMVSGDRLQTAKDALAVAVTILESYQKQNYGPAEYQTLVAGSDKFLTAGKKASMVLPEQVVFLGGYFTIKHPPIMYDGHILVALDDLYQYINATIEYMYNNATMVIQSPDKTLEIVAGKNAAYLNDTPQSMPVPVLSYDNTIYISAESFAQFYGISYKYISDQGFLILYNNLNQLTNTSVPNKLNKG